MSKTSHAAKRQTSTTNVILIAVLISVLAIALAAYIGKGLFASIQLSAKIMDKKSQAAETLEKNLEAAPLLIKAYDELGEDKRTLVEHALPSDDDYSGLIALIERVGGVSAMSVQSIALAGVANSAPVTDTVAVGTNGPTSPEQLNFTTNLTGSYAGVKAMLQNLELSARPMKVTQISLSGTNPGLTAQIGLTTWYEKSANLKLGKETVK